MTRILFRCFTLMLGLSGAATVCAIGQEAKTPDAPGISLKPPAIVLPKAPDELEPVRQLIAQRSFAGAETALRAYLAANPASGAGHRLLAYCLLRTGRAREALPEYTRAAQLMPPTAEDFKNVAQAYALLEDYPEAVRWGTRAVQQDPADADAWYSLGRIEYTRQHFTEALGCFEKTLVLAPRSMKAENNRGLALEGLNRNDDALAAYRQAVTWGDESGTTAGMEQPLLNLATALVHRGQPDQALPLLTRAEKIAPSDAKIHEQLGHIYLDRQQPGLAVKEVEQAVALEPASSALHYLLGQSYKRQGLAEKARAEFERAAAMMGTHSSQN